MSVIFKTLKKLKSESVEKNNENKLVRRRIYFFNNSFQSTSALLYVFLILTIIGAGTLYGYYNYRDKKVENTKGFAGPKTDLRQSADGHTPENLVVKGTKGLNRTRDVGSDRIEYIPPQANDNTVEVYSLKKSEDAGMPSIKVKKTWSKSKEAIKRNVVSKTKIEKKNKPEAAEVSSVPEVEKIFLANAKKNAKIARLVANIRWEMARGNDRQTEKLFNELASLKGQDNSYFLKLKAVWHMHKKEFERAVDLLKTVLTKNELDPEAGINMAIIEIKTHHMQKAYERLKKLRAIYPENIRIAEILQNMEPLLNKSRIRHLSRDINS